MPIVEVEWVDSRSHGTDWQDPDDLNATLDTPDGLCCRTAGYLYRATRRDVVLSANVASNGDVGAVMQIPTGAVRRLRLLRRAPPE